MKIKCSQVTYRSETSWVRTVENQRVNVLCKDRHWPFSQDSQLLPYERIILQFQEKPEIPVFKINIGTKLQTNKQTNMGTNQNKHTCELNFAKSQPVHNLRN